MSIKENTNISPLPERVIPKIKLLTGESSINILWSSTATGNPPPPSKRSFSVKVSDVVAFSGIALYCSRISCRVVHLDVPFYPTFKGL